MTYFGSASDARQGDARPGQPSALRAERVLFVHAHPDDETIATGGTIAALVDAGAEVTIVTCTRGELGEVMPDDLARLRGDEAALAAHREGEIAEAMRDLGVRDHRFLGDPEARTHGLPARVYRDSGMVWRSDGVAGPTPDLHGAAFCAAEFGEIVSDLQAVVESVRPTAIVSYDEDGGYHHPDHVRANRAAVRVARLAEVPFFAVVAGAEQATGAEAEALAADDSVRTVDVRASTARRLAALRRYRTQVEVVDLPRGAAGILFPHGAVQHLGTSESFRFVPEPDSRASGPAGASEFADMSTGGRVATTGLALAAGAVFGALGTVAHQGTVTVAGAPIWSGLVLSLVMAAALLAGMRLLFGSRVVAVAVALGLLGAAALLSQPGAGGSALVPANGPGYAWTFGPLLIAMVVIAWPTLPPRGAGPDAGSTAASSTASDSVPTASSAGTQPTAR
ncbi:PIG-L family deacetylase [Frigoribacterium sp. VKM Ac-2530]|uniref:PIG-L family deacetylase n=1 Tax=Frigoribacterium sp. VKM Ac-2530 TaxID=2783822 RepID=UPI00188A2102|nr:PIG-L family deacetylase [Frigoribacterium sp. VKM Ac-2530]MBF4579956.1 PIG-L family deacetylase [Frigoribacterium sp. VKM Ac-2530]